MVNKERCPACGSENIEETQNINWFCCDCDTLFTTPDMNMVNKYRHNMLLYENEEMSLEEIIHRTLKYISGFGLVPDPMIQKDLQQSLQLEDPIDEIIMKISQLEAYAEFFAEQRSQER